MESLSLLWKILLEFIFGALLSIRQIFKQPDHVVLQQSKTLCSADGYLVLLDFLKLVNSVADVDPTSCTGILNDRIGRILLGGYFVDWLSISLEDFTVVSGSDSSCEHGSMSSNGDVPNWKEIVLGMVVWIDVDFACCDEDEGRIDIDRELDVTVFVSIQFEFGLLFGGFIEGFVLLLLVLHLLLDDFVDFAQPFCTGEHFRLSQLQGRNAGNTYLVDLRKEQLVVDLPFEVRWMVAGQSFALFLNFLQEDLEVVRLHQQDGSSHEFQEIDVFTELLRHLIADLEAASALRLVLHLLIGNDFLAVPSQPRDHLLYLTGSLVEIFDLGFHLVFQFSPVGLIVNSDGDAVLTGNHEQNLLLVVSPTLLIFLALCFVLKINFSLILLDLHDSVDQLLQPPREVVRNREILVSLRLLKFSKAILPCISNGDIVCISILIYSQQQVNIVLLGPPDCRTLAKQQPERDEVQQPIPVDLSAIGQIHVLEGILTILPDQVFNSEQQLQSLGVLHRSLREHDVLIPLFQIGLVFLVLELVLLDQLLQEYLQVCLVLRERESQCSKEGISVGFDFRQWLVLQLPSN